MSLFISYSHTDSKIVEKIAGVLAARNKHVWLDKWELNYGDSLLEVVQDALTESSALLIMLSKKSVASEWCKKEVNAALLRELEEKKVVAVPVLLEECDIPIFLRGKLYADFTGDFNIAINKLDASLSKHTDISMNRVESIKENIDWAIDYGESNNSFIIKIISVSIFVDKEYSISCNYEIISNKMSLAENAHEKVDRILFGISKRMEPNECKYIISNSVPVIIKKKFTFDNENIDFVITFRWMGNNDGFDKLYDYSKLLEHILEHRLKVMKNGV